MIWSEVLHKVASKLRRAIYWSVSCNSCGEYLANDGGNCNDTKLSPTWFEHAKLGTRKEIISFGRSHGWAIPDGIAPHVLCPPCLQTWAAYSATVSGEHSRKTRTADEWAQLFPSAPSPALLALGRVVIALTENEGDAFLMGWQAAVPDDSVVVPRDLLESLAEWDDCDFSFLTGAPHGARVSGGCQAHGYLSLAPGEICPQRQLQDLLKASDHAV